MGIKLIIYLLKFKIQKHQKYALYTILICLIIIVISNSCFMLISNEINTQNWILVIFSISFNYLFRSLIDVIYKYLLEYIFFNQLISINRNIKNISIFN